MFLSHTGFIRLMKNAYKSVGLGIRNQDEVIEFKGGYWHVTIDRKLIPKDVLGEIIAMTGALPDNREAFTATKEGNQQEFWLDDYVSALQAAMEAGSERGEEIYVSKVVYLESGRNLRILQTPSLKTVLINNAYLNTVDVSAIDTDHDEQAPEGPKMTKDGWVCWQNNWMAFAVARTSTVSGEKIVEQIGYIDLQDAEVKDE